MEDDGATLTVEQRRYIEVIRRNGRSLLALVDQLAEVAPSARAGGRRARRRRGRRRAPRGARAGDGEATRRRHCPRRRRRRGRVADRGRSNRAPAHRQLHRSRRLRGHARRLRRGRPGPAAQPAVRGGRARSGHAGHDRAWTCCAPRAPRTVSADVRFIVLSAMYMTKNERAGARTRGHRRGAQGGDDGARADLCAPARQPIGACGAPPTPRRRRRPSP